MANELLKNAQGDAVPQKLADGAGVSAGDLNGDETVWAIFEDPAQGGGSTLDDVVVQLQNGSFEISAIDDSVANTSSEAFENGTSIESDSNLRTSLVQAGARELSGIVTRLSSSYDVDIEWLDGPAGNVIQTESVASGVSAGTQTTFNVPARSPYVNVLVADEDNSGSLGAGDVSASYHLR